MNQVNLVGRLTRDPEIKNTTTGKMVATFTLAVDRKFKNASGEREADFIPIVVWDKPAGIIEKYTSKGSQIGIGGRLQVRSYDANDGQRKYVTEVIANDVYLLSSNTQKSENFSPKVKIEEVDLSVDEDEIPF